MDKLLATIGLTLIAQLTCAHQPENKPDNDWSRIKTPTTGLSESVGGYANGCMTGAISLPASGEGYVDMRRYRNRYYGQPQLIEFIKALGQFTLKTHGRKHLIGDLSQPRGGKMNFGHSSHQIGLDVDIWMQTIKHQSSVNPYRDMKTIVDKANGTIVSGRIEKPTRDALHFAATYPAVARIFVNPVVKKSLCQTESDTSWLRKIRPWWGHDQHFHVRLQCPQGSSLCKNQKPIPQGSGCNEGLYHWVQEQSDIVTGKIKPRPKFKMIRKKPPKVMPMECDNIRYQP
ncbi:MAG: penicillin-insensitive murein endopeptidase [Gammaproteobacteria bacterium]|nr:MAG: penicillin-insensitive murein endopeptidase [Gammaproteobacteria bacterium]